MKRTLLYLAVCGVGFLVMGKSAFAEDAAGAKTKVAVMKIASSGEGVKGEKIEESIREEITAMETHDVLTQDTMTVEINNAKEMGVDCVGDDVPCLIRLGILMQVDELLIPTVTADDTRVTLRLRRVQVENASDELVVERIVLKEEEIQGTILKEMVRLILNPERYAGSLYVAPNIAGARIFLDGQDMGPSPHQKPFFPIFEGPHHIRIEHPGYVPWESEAVVLSGETKTVEVKLVEMKAEVAPTGKMSQNEVQNVTEEIEDPVSGAFWLGAATLVLGGGGALGAGAAALAIDFILQSTSVGDYEQRTRLLGAEQTLAVMGIASAVVFLAGGVLLTIGLLE